MRPLTSVLMAIGLMLAATTSIAQNRSIPFVLVQGADDQWRSYETNAIPLLFNRVRFGWRLHIGGPDRTVSILETMTTSQPMAEVILGPGIEVNPEKTKVTARFSLPVQDGRLERTQGIIPGDPPGTYTYDVAIDGEPRGEFVFCAIELPDQDRTIDPYTLHCPNKFHSVGRLPAPIVSRASFLPLF